MKKYLKIGLIVGISIIIIAVLATTPSVLAQISQSFPDGMPHPP